jgi:REP element-mobilizing transposase RayT
MGSTHLSIHFHLVFATKNHERLIEQAWRQRLRSYLGGILSSLEAIPEIVGGVEDHVHLLAGLRATHRLSDVMRELKASSSRWVHEEISISNFGWQEGYGAFTVSASQCETVRQYIARQEEHHRTRTFREEYLELLQKSGVKYEAKYLW